MSNKKIDYDFNAVTPYEYELFVTMATTSRMFNYILAKARSKLANKGVKVPHTAGIKKIEIIPQYFKLIKTTINKQIKQISKEIKKDKIELLSCDVVRAYFDRKDIDEWLIIIKLIGNYADKR